MQYLSRTLPSLIRGKTALVRVDFNVENQEESFRLRAALPTLRFLLAQNTKIVLLSHRGRPQTKSDKRKLSLKPLTRFLERNLGRRVTFISSIDEKSKKKIATAPAKSIFLLENLRFDPREDGNERSLALELSELGDFFVNDAFSVSHRENASVTELPRLLPSVAGLLLEKELLGLNGFINGKKEGLVIILGGAKASDKIGVLKRLISGADAVLLGGVPANIFLKAQGFDIGKSAFEPTMLPVAATLLKKKNIVLPIDFLWHNGKMLDIGPRSVDLFIEKLSSAKTIFWNGPLGYFEQDRFKAGSERIAKAIIESGAFSVVGGGETTQLINSMGASKKFGFLSTGGGAMLEYLSGTELPGLRALEKARLLR